MDPSSRLLGPAERGDWAVGARLGPAGGEELRRPVRAQLARESQGYLLHTPLTDETCERMVGKEPVEWANRRLFFTAPTETVRRVPVIDACHKRKDETRRQQGAGPATRRAASARRRPANGADARPGAGTSNGKGGRIMRWIAARGTVLTRLAVFMVGLLLTSCARGMMVQTIAETLVKQACLAGAEVVRR